jgi:hypothetical protein
MRFTMKHLVLIAGAVAAAACQDDHKEIAAPITGSARRAESTGSPVVRITSPLSNDVVAGGEGRVGAGSLTGGSAFAIVIETATNDAADVPANESINIRNTALLGQPNPNFPGLTVLIDADLITPDGTIIPKNTNLANLFNTLGTDDTPGNGVTIWAGWHVLESFPDDVKNFTITASVRDAAGRVGTDVVKVKVDKHGSSGQALTPAPAAVAGDGLEDYDGPEVTFVGPRDPSSVALGTATAPAFTFFQISASDRTGAGIGVNENGAGITTPVGLIRDGGQFAAAGANRNFPGLEFTFDVDFRRGNGAIVPAGQNLAPAFDIAGTTLDHRGNGRTTTTASWVAGGSFILPAGKTSVTVTTRVTDTAGKTGSVSRTFAISHVGDGQLLTPQP